MRVFRVNRLATKGERYYRLPPLSIFVFRQKRSEEHFVFFLAYEVTRLKVIIELPVIFLLFGRKSAGSFCRTICGTRAHETSRNLVPRVLSYRAGRGEPWERG